ncbi:putative fatty acyl-CoA reductase CG5065 [Caerostris darwini]|uniref:Fatty acyl-CoA reductase n=1 Tax=Caerostris darwini TaxID=1538125 RepID=A0AAV4UEC0_9ARAC|nr:putative fatty acyl-CoA reductase CG5065 [Caerostris darwini]
MGVRCRTPILLKMLESTAQMSIPSVYAGKSIFITGATGFLGKVLLEKLLRSCQDISEIIVLLNNAYETEVFEKKKSKLLESSVFDRLKEQSPSSLDKICFVAGDVTLQDLGLKQEDLEKIVNEASFVFHCAASVRFEDKPRTILMINVVGVDRVAKICLKMKKLEAMVHVSTAFSFCHRPIIAEETNFEKLPVSVLQNIEFLDDDRLEWICDSYRKNRPSNYQFSKALSETLIVKEYSSRLPIIIVRPAIITAAAREPFPGWIDNYNGPSGFLAMSVKGVLKTLLVKNRVYADWVPVDLVANTLIVAAYAVVMEKNVDMGNFNSAIPIINCVCPTEKLITWDEVVEICMPILHKYPSETVYSVPGGIVTSNKIIHELCKYTLHFVPAFFMDIYSFVTKGKMKMMRSYKRIHGVMNHLQLYTTRRFHFTSKSMDTLINMMNFEDSQEFPIDQREIDWNKYMEDFVHGVRLFFLKEKDTSLPLAHRNVYRLQIVTSLIKMIPVAILLIYLVKNFIKPRSGFQISNLLSLGRLLQK